MQEENKSPQNMEEQENKSIVSQPDFDTDNLMQDDKNNIIKTDLTDKNSFDGVKIIYERPENNFNFSDVKNKDKKTILIFSLIGLLLSVFYVGIVFSLLGFFLTLTKFKEIEKSSLLKWSLATSFCGVVISVCFILSLFLL